MLLSTNPLLHGPSAYTVSQNQTYIEIGVRMRKLLSLQKWLWGLLENMVLQQRLNLLNAGLLNLLNKNNYQYQCDVICAES